MHKKRRNILNTIEEILTFAISKEEAYELYSRHARTT